MIIETLSAGNVNPPSTTPTTVETQSVSQTTTITPILKMLPIAETLTAEKATDPTTNTISIIQPTIETQTDGQATNHVVFSSL